MGESLEGRPGFTEWIDQENDPNWIMLPLTHVTNALKAEDIIRSGKLQANHCAVLKSNRAFLFYGRPSYRPNPDGVLKSEVASPICFIFDSSLIATSTDIFAFDTGAFAKRLHQYITDGMDVADFSLQKTPTRINRLIAKVFSSQEGYLRPDPSSLLDPEVGASPWEFHARAYLHTVRSRGRNETDDRVSTIEISFDSDIELLPKLKAVIVPHTFWGEKGNAPWLVDLKKQTGIEVKTYMFLPGRAIDYYYAHVESAVFELYQKWKIM